MNSPNITLWEDDNFLIQTLSNPHIPYNEGLHLVIFPKQAFRNAWDNPEFSAKAFELAAKTCKILEQQEMAPWFNIQANGNWGLLPGNKPTFHVHIYGRNKTKNWGKPLKLPEMPGTFQNKPMPNFVCKKLREAFKSLH